MLRFAFIANAVISGFFGLGFLLAPEMALGGFGIQVTPAVALMSRFMGGVVLGNVLISVIAAGSEPSRLRTMAAYGFVVWHGLGALLAVQAVATGVFNTMGASAIVLDGGLTVLLLAGALGQRSARALATA